MDDCSNCRSLERENEELRDELKEKERRISDLESTLADIEHKARYA